MGAFLDMSAFSVPPQVNTNAKKQFKISATSLFSLSAAQETHKFSLTTPDALKLPILVCMPLAICSKVFMFTNYYPKSHQLEFLFFSDHLIQNLFFLDTYQIQVVFAFCNTLFTLCYSFFMWPFSYILQLFIQCFCLI